MSAPESNLPAPAVSLDVLKLRIASQLAPRAWRRSLEQVTNDLESGQSWEQAIGRCGPATGALAALLNAGMEAGHPADIALAILQRRASMKHSWQQMTTALLYPTILLAVALIICSLTGMMLMNVDAGLDLVKGVEHFAQDFNDTAWGSLLFLAWALVLVGSAYVVASPKAWFKLVGSTPLVGRPYRWLAMSEMLSRVAVFSRYRPVLTEALQFTARSYGNDALSAITQHVADDVERGQTFRHALHHTILSDERAGISLTIIKMDGPQFGESIERASRLLEQMTQYTCTRLKLVYPLFVLLIIASFVWGAWASYIAIFNALSDAFLY